MTKLFWSPAALSDIQRLYRFLAKEDQVLASRAIREIRASIKILALHPNVGRPVPDMDPLFREWTIDFGKSGYVAMCRLDGDSIIILAVRHQKEAGY